MIIEFHFTPLEAAENDEHLGSCEDNECGHLAHLVEDIMDGYADAADVFGFVERTTSGYLKRLGHNKDRRMRDKRLAKGDAAQARSLAIIRRGWDRLYGTDAT